MARQRLDADRLAAAYERDGRRLLVFFTRRTYDAQLAVDLVAETYARAFEQRRRFAADPTDRDALAGWVFGIGRNVLHEALRRGRAERRALARLGVEPPALEAEEQIRIEELAALGELRSAVQGALAELGPEQREAVRLRVVDELGYPAVAARLGVSEQTARARVSRGLRALAAAVDRHETGAQGRHERARPRRHPRRARPRPARGVGAPAAPRAARALAAGPRARARAAGARPDGAGHPRRDLGARSGAAARRRAAARPFAPQRTGAQVYVAAGAERGVAWRLTASACDYGRRARRRRLPHRARGRGRGALRRRQPPARRRREPERPRAAPGADLLRSRVGAHVGLRRPARRGAHGRRDQRGGGTRVAATPADPDAVAKGGLPAGMRVFVAVLDGAHDVPLVTARDASGAALLVCREGRCAPPTQGGTP